ncbi:MAG: regulatory protein RecX [Clostridia bacterium]|nr:regulatory protein RecX [Clostridia bacterium]
MPVFKESEQKKSTVTLYFDDRTSLTIRTKDFSKVPLTEGDDIELIEYTGKICALQLNEAYEAALTLLDYSDRTESEIHKKLLMKGFLGDVIEAVIERLKGARLINDKALAKRITDSASAKRMGTYALKRKMRQRGLSEEDTEEALENMPPEIQEEAADKEAARLVKKYEKLPQREKYAKLTQALARRGFTWDAISSAVDKIRSDDFEEYD